MDSPLDQLSFLVSEFEKEKKMDSPEVRALVGRAVTAIERIAGSQSHYALKASRVYQRNNIRFIYPEIKAITLALRDDVEVGWLSTVRETIHAEVFSDYLEMASHLLENGFKDPAAVVVGSTLENHIKKLCEKHHLSTENDNGKAIKLDTLNADLAKAGVYSKLDLKNVTAWSGLRNDAAHGEYDKYSVEQVSILLDSVRNFIARLPA